MRLRHEKVTIVTPYGVDPVTMDLQSKSPKRLNVDLHGQ